MYQIERVGFKFDGMILNNKSFVKDKIRINFKENGNLTILNNSIQEITLDEITAIYKTAKEIKLENQNEKESIDKIKSDLRSGL